MVTQALSWMRRVPDRIAHIDRWLALSLAGLYFLGLLTMNSYTAENPFFDKQVAWVAGSMLLMLLVSFSDTRFLRRQESILAIFLLSAASLVALFFAGSTFQGAQSWFSLGGLVLQPSDPAKLALILLLSKYFSRRHIEIANLRHILVSGLYTFIFFLLVLFQPDFGSAIIMFLIWLSMVLVSGISKKHLGLVFVSALVAFAGLWSFGFEDYQKQRVISFVHPLTDIRGAGYNAYQSMVAVGSGEVFGKGIGYGTQSRLRFLPESETDFIFAAFAEEWGLLGALLVLFLFGVIIWRVLKIAVGAESNFETLYAVGFASLIFTQMAVHIGMNLGLLPVTGVTLPFMSYGGSHILTEAMGLGILFSMNQRGGPHREDLEKEFVGR